MKITNWQDAVAIAIGAERASPTKRREAFQYLYDTGIGKMIGGKMEQTIEAMIADGSIKAENDNG